MNIMYISVIMMLTMLSCGGTGTKDKSRVSYTSLITDHVYEYCDTSCMEPIKEKMCAGEQADYADSVYKALILQICKDYPSDSTGLKNQVNYWNDSARKCVDTAYRACGMDYYCSVASMQTMSKFHKEKIIYLESKFYP